jgi:DME family drug/metabolite transporter
LPDSASPVPRLAAACGAAFLWGTGSLVVNLLVVRHGYAPQSISFWRFVLGSAALLAVFGRGLPWRRLAADGLPLLVSGVVMAGYVLAWFQGIARIGAAIPTLIALCLPPVFVTMWALARGQVRVSAGLVALLAMAVGGAATLVVGGHPDGLGETASATPAASNGPLVTTGSWLAGVAFSVASALLYAGFTLASPRLSRQWGAGVATTALTLSATGVMALSGLVWPLQLPRELTPEAWLLYLGMVTAALALLAFSWGAQRLTPTALTIATLVEPLTAVVLASLLLGERLHALQWAGAALLLASLFGWGRREAAAAAPHESVVPLHGVEARADIDSGGPLR